MDSRFSNAYDNVTTLHPIGIALLLAAILAIFVVRREWMLLPIIVLTCLAPAAQRVVVLGFDLHFMRILVIFAWLRLITRGERRPLHWTTLDRLVLWWAFASTLIFAARRASSGAIVNALGQAADAIGLYFLGRQVIREWKDAERVVLSFALAAVPVSVMGLIELVTKRNPFAFYGYVPELAIERDGRVRLRGAFSHQILAGAYWVVPTFLCCAALVQRRLTKLVPALGLFSCLFLIGASASSTPLMGLVLGIGGALLWPLRERMRHVRWAGVAALVLIQLAMSKPIWHLYQRVAAFGVGGSTGYHRYRLVDAFVRNFSQWALLGTNSTGVWGRQLEDVTNHFIGQGVRTGLLGFSLFVGVFVAAFSQVGAARAHWRHDRSREMFAWMLGVALFAQTMMMTATSYFGQIELVMWVSLAAIGSITPGAGIVSAGPVESPRVDPPVQRAVQAAASLGNRLLRRRNL